jgi:hypothetical protein
MKTADELKYHISRHMNEMSHTTPHEMTAYLSLRAIPLVAGGSSCGVVKKWNSLTRAEMLSNKLAKQRQQ